MSTECKKELEAITKQRDYYKRMYEMRTEAYIKELRRLESLVEKYEVSSNTCVKEFNHFKEVVRKVYK